MMAFLMDSQRAEKSELLADSMVEKLVVWRDVKSVSSLVAVKDDCLVV
jgi:hypothetical protein